MIVEVAIMAIIMLVGMYDIGGITTWAEETIGPGAGALVGADSPNYAAYVTYGIQIGHYWYIFVGMVFLYYLWRRNR